jgi:RNA polymerase sigma factor (sigma-70 family)
LGWEIAKYPGIGPSIAACFSSANIARHVRATVSRGALSIGRAAAGSSVMSDHSISAWITDLNAGDATAVERIFDRYFPQVIELARRNLRLSPRRAADEEDVALEALDSFFRGVSQGRFSKLRDRHDLWRLLVTLTIRKAAAQLRRETRQKRGGGRVRGESVFLQASDRAGPHSLEHAVGPDPRPELVVSMVENCQRLLDQLPDEMLQAVALYRLQGFTHREIASKIGRAPETVNRKLRRIREIWSEESEK